MTAEIRKTTVEGITLNPAREFSDEFTASIDFKARR